MKRMLSIVMYHYVRPIKTSRYPAIKGMELEDFVRQLDYFAENYSVITMDELYFAIQNPVYQLPDNAILLTFDDGYMDHYQYVFPELKKRNMQGSFFVPTQVLNEPVVLDVNKIHYILASRDADEIIDWLFQRFDQLRAEGVNMPSNQELYDTYAVANRWDRAETIFVKRVLQNGLPENLRNQLTKELFDEVLHISEEDFSAELYMNTAQMQEMKSHGMFFGSHGHGHYHLGKQSENKIREDIQNSIDFLLGTGLVESHKIVMNYPYGTVSDTAIKVTKELGCAMGLTVDARQADLNQDNKYLLPRFDTNDFWPKGSL